MLPLFSRCTQLWPTAEVAFLLCPLFRALQLVLWKVPKGEEDSILRGPMATNMKAF